MRILDPRKVFNIKDSFLFRVLIVLKGVRDDVVAAAAVNHFICYAIWSWMELNKYLIFNFNAMKRQVFYDFSIEIVGLWWNRKSSHCIESMMNAEI